MTEILEEIRYLKQKYIRNVENIKEYTEQKNSLNNDLLKEESKKEEYENVLFASKVIIEKITYENKVNLESFLTNALKNIFTDRNYEIVFVMKEDTKKPGLELTLVENGVAQEITDAVGGGIVSTLGLLLQIYYIESFGLNKAIFIDEGLKELSSTKLADPNSDQHKSYLENLLSFLKWLSKDKQYKLVLVTHDSKVREYADKIYEVKKGVVKEC